MKKNTGFKRTHILLKKLIFTFGILLIYFVGRNIPLYGMDLSVNGGLQPDAESILRQAIGGDVRQKSIFLLGISPHITASIIVMLSVGLRSRESRERMSQKRVDKVTLILTFGLAVYQGIMSLKGLTFINDGFLTEFICVLQMVTGAMLIMFMCDMNKQKGIGGQTPVILVNIADTFISTLKQEDRQALIIVLSIGLVVVAITLLMEANSFKIGLQSLSVYNLYSDRNYLAIKLNPIGVMPIMFSTAFFTLIQTLAAAITGLLGQDGAAIEGLVLSKPLGLCVYLAGVYVLNFLLTVIMVKPKDIAEQYQKSGDSLENIHPGRPTKRYLRRVIFGLSFLSSSIMAICIGVPLILSSCGLFNETLAMLPISMMLFSGMFCNIGQELTANAKMDAYRPLF